MRSPLRLPSLNRFGLFRSAQTDPGFAGPGQPEVASYGSGLDLLRERRQALGQEPIAVALADRRRLIGQGVVLGAVVLGVVVGLTALVYLRYQMVKAQMGQLSQVEGEATQLRKELGARKGSLDQINNFNQQLVSNLTSARSSSALMTELQLRLPSGIQLLAVDASGPALVLRGLTFDPNAFERINALLLELQKSPLLDPSAISLTKVERKPAEASLPVGVRPPVGFELSAGFVTLKPAQQLPFLSQLGAGGLARRLQLLQREGLLP